MPSLLAIYAFALGAVVGSFLNVVIHRWPREESIVFPGSHCPRCNAPIRWYDNIPIASWLVLRGRCRNCREPIAARYPLVELANALFYLAIYLRTGPTVGLIPVAIFALATLRDALPFGVFLGLALLVVFFFGPTLAAWYFKVAGT